MEQDFDQYNTHAQDVNVEQFTNETALRIRLDTTQLKYQLQMFLEGKQESIQRNNMGNLITVTKNRGTPMANDIGIQRIMSFFETAVNSQVVQGNLQDDQYEWFMQRCRQDLNRHIFVNMYNYDISQEQYGLIVDMICNTIELFISRTIRNEERKSYANFMSHFENTSASQNQKKDNIWSKLQIGK